MTVLTLSLTIAVLSVAYLVTHVILRNRRRVRTEIRQDVLKQLYHLREKHHDVTVESIAGVLQTPQDVVADVLAELHAEGVAEIQGESVRLTEGGIHAALSLVRSHRLWERYLADETGVGEEQWHAKAEKQEHRLTRDDANALSRRLGHPMYDPHGDPIPQKGLELPGPQGLPLASGAIGSDYIVIHLEDEPTSVYNELVTREVFRGSRIRLMYVGRTHAEIVCDGREIELPLLCLSNVTVVPTRERTRDRRKGKSLSDLRVGEEATVRRLSPACRGMQRRRLLDLGILPGTMIRAELESPFGDPTGYRIRGSLVALRKSEASLVDMEVEQ